MVFDDGLLRDATVNGNVQAISRQFSYLKNWLRLQFLITMRF